MENLLVLVFKIPSEEELGINTMVVYENKSGEFRKLGRVTNISEGHGEKLYHLDSSIATRARDQLRLLRETDE